MTAVEKVSAFLTEAGTFYLATIHGDVPKCRPLGLHLVAKDTIYFGVGEFKDVYKQMQINPHVEICTAIGRNFLRYYGTAVFDPDPALEEAALNLLPNLRKVYNPETGNKLGMFHLVDATAEFREMMEILETFHF